MLAVLGLQNVADLAHNIETEVGVTKEVAESLAQDISATIFEPIRQELERELSHPAAKTEEVSGVDAMRNDILGKNATEASAAISLAAEAREATAPVTSVTTGPVAPTPPAPAPDGKAVREPLPGAYHPEQPSTTRKTIEGDPYRESLT